MPEKKDTPSSPVLKSLFTAVKVKKSSRETGEEVEKMRVNESCARCLYDKQMHLTQDIDYLEEIRNIIENRSENDCSPYLVYLFSQVYKRRFGDRKPYSDIKKKYNDLVLSMEEPLKKQSPHWIRQM